EPALLGRLANEDVQLLDAGRLGQVVVGPELHGLDRGGDLLEAGHHDHLRALRELLQLAQDLDALHVWHLHVQQQHVGQVLLELLERGAAVGHPAHRVALAPQLADQELAQVLLVVGHQHPDRRGHGCGLPVPAGCSGRITRKAVPAPTRVSTSIRPSWSATMPWAMASPSPVPCPGGLVVKKGSNTRGSTCSGMPGPWSWKVTSTSRALRRRVVTVSMPFPSIASSALLASPRNTWRSWPSLATTSGSSAPSRRSKRLPA